MYVILSVCYYLHPMKIEEKGIIEFLAMKQRKKSIENILNQFPWLQTETVWYFAS